MLRRPPLALAPLALALPWLAGGAGCGGDVKDSSGAGGSGSSGAGGPGGPGGSGSAGAGSGGGAEPGHVVLRRRRYERHARRGQGVRALVAVAARRLSGRARVRRRHGLPRRRALSDGQFVREHARGGVVRLDQRHRRLGRDDRPLPGALLERRRARARSRPRYGARRRARRRARQPRRGRRLLRRRRLSHARHEQLDPDRSERLVAPRHVPGPDGGQRLDRGLRRST